MSHPYTRTRRAEQGFSLAEMLAVVALVGLLMAIAVPNFIRIRRIAAVTRNANTLYVSIMRARQLAIRRGRPIILKFNQTATTLEVRACLDSNFSYGSSGAVPGADSPTAATCTGGDLPGGANDSFPLRDSPLGANLQVLSFNVARPEISFGHPAATGSTYTAVANNFVTPIGVNWIEFGPTGKLLPNGALPFTPLQDITQLGRLPVLNPVPPPGGPEFYFAEVNPTSVTRPRDHVYRKITIASFGGVAVESWVVDVNTNSGHWSGPR